MHEPGRWERAVFRMQGFPPRSDTAQLAHGVLNAS
jgi:hypothetical protein